MRIQKSTSVRKYHTRLQAAKYERAAKRFLETPKYPIHQVNLEAAATRAQLVVALVGVVPNRFQACGMLSKHTRGIHDFRIARVPVSMNAAIRQIIEQLSLPATKSTKRAPRRAA